MKLFWNRLYVSMIICSCSLYSAEKPSAWSKFKNIFKSKKQANDKEMPMKDQASQNDQNFFQSIQKLYEKVAKFYDYSQEHMIVFNNKIRGLKAMQEQGNKASQKEQLKMPLKRLRADLLMSFIEYLKETKIVLNDIKIFMKERKYSTIKTFDSLLQTFDKIIKEGDLLTEQLLQASEAYGLKDNVKKVELKINDYFKKVAQLFSSIKTPIDYVQGIVNKAIVPLLKGITFITLGGAKPLLLLCNQLDAILKLVQIGTNIARDIIEGNNKQSIKEISVLQDESLRLTQLLKSNKKDIEEIENVLNKNESASQSSGLNKDKNTNKSTDALKKEINYGKSFDTTDNQEDELVFEDLSPKKTK